MATGANTIVGADSSCLMHMQGVIKREHLPIRNYPHCRNFSVAIMSTKHSKAAEKFLQDSKMAAWHNETLWMVRAEKGQDEQGSSRMGRASQQGL